MNDALWMLLGIVVWETGKFAGVLIADWYYGKPKEIELCSHGVEWDDCPDCCH